MENNRNEQSMNIDQQVKEMMKREKIIESTRSVDSRYNRQEGSGEKTRQPENDVNEKTTDGPETTFPESKVNDDHRGLPGHPEEN